jgi:hypothetical protein
MKQEAGMAWNRKRKKIQLVNVAAVNRSRYGSSISSQASNPTGV